MADDFRCFCQKLEELKRDEIVKLRKEADNDIVNETCRILKQKQWNSYILNLFKK